MKGDSYVFNCTLFHKDQHYFSTHRGSKRTLPAYWKV